MSTDTQSSGLHISLISALSKKWADASDAEKLEKLRAEIRDYSRLSNRVFELEKQVSDLRRHTHTMMVRSSYRSRTKDLTN